METFAAFKNEFTLLLSVILSIVRKYVKDAIRQKMPEAFALISPQQMFIPLGLFAAPCSHFHYFTLSKYS